MQVAEFWAMTPREFDLAVQGYVEERTELRNEAYDRARLGAFLTKIEFQGKKSGRVSPQDLYRFSWEAPAKHSVHRLTPGIKNPDIQKLMSRKIK